MRRVSPPTIPPPSCAFDAPGSRALSGGRSINRDGSYVSYFGNEYPAAVLMTEFVGKPMTSSTVNHAVVECSVEMAGIPVSAVASSSMLFGFLDTGDITNERKADGWSERSCDMELQGCSIGSSIGPLNKPTTTLDLPPSSPHSPTCVTKAVRALPLSAAVPYF
jgi:hypothetical protein